MSSRLPPPNGRLDELLDVKSLGKELLLLKVGGLVPIAPLKSTHETKAEVMIDVKKFSENLQLDFKNQIYAAFNQITDINTLRQHLKTLHENMVRALEKPPPKQTQYGSLRQTSVPTTSPYGAAPKKGAEGVGSAYVQTPRTPSVTSTDYGVIPSFIEPDEVPAGNRPSPTQPAPVEYGQMPSTGLLQNANDTVKTLNSQNAQPNQISDPKPPQMLPAYSTIPRPIGRTTGQPVRLPPPIELTPKRPRGRPPTEVKGLPPRKP